MEEAAESPAPRAALWHVASLYDNWCRRQPEVHGNKTLWRLVEGERGRTFALRELPGRVLNHYVSHEEIATLLDALQFPEVAFCIRQLLPAKAIGRSGDLGEILAVEFVEEVLDYTVPIRRLRFKDHREMAMRGEDVIGAAYDDENRLNLLKGEAKSARSLSRATVKEARERLDERHGRPSANSLIFVARQLLSIGDSETNKLGRDILREAATRTMPSTRIAHLLFTFSGNIVNDIIQADVDGADGTRKQHSANLRIPTHGEFVKAVYEGVHEEVEIIGHD